MTEFSNAPFLQAPLYASPLKVETLTRRDPVKHNLVWGMAITVFAIVSSVIVAGTSVLHIQSSVEPVTVSAAQPAVTPPAPKVETKAPAVAAPKPTKPAAPSVSALQTILNNWRTSYKGDSFGVYVKELGSQKRSASLNANVQFEAASLYKLYLSDYLYNKIQKGTYSLSSQIGVPKSLGECIKLMITISDNYCGEGIGSTIGWLTLQNFARASGFSRTTLYGYNATTASDMARYLEKLQNGQLIGSSYRSSLLGYMRQQIYRSAIPAGVPGIAVADKVGFIGSTWNDAAIVYHPKGTYVLVVLSKNAGTAPIKDLSKRLATFFNK